VEESEEFIARYEAQEIDNTEYSELIRRSFPAFEQSADALEKVGVHIGQDIENMQRYMQSVNRLQKAHRDYLLKLRCVNAYVIPF
jgi:hypothetical protein